MQKKEIYFLIFILTALLAAGLLIYCSKKTEVLPASETQSPFPGYSYKNVMYNFWGFVSAKESNSVSVEGLIPDPGEITADRPYQTIKFIITADTKIVKLKTTNEKIRQVFVSQSAIQLKDHLALKTDKIDTVKKEAIATDIVILEPLPPMPPPPKGTATSSTQ